MAFSKLTKIILWVVAGISLIVILFFYIGPKTVTDYDALVDRVDEALSGVDMSPVAPMPVIDTTLTDSAAIADNIASVQKAQEERMATPVAEVSDADLDDMFVTLQKQHQTWKENKQLIRFLAKLFHTKHTAITIVSGLTGRHKRVCIK